MRLPSLIGQSESKDSGEHPEWCEIEVINEIIRHAFRIKSEPIPETLEKHLQQRVEEWRAHQSDSVLKTESSKSTSLRIV
jgi:hypothetical protein